MAKVRIIFDLLTYIAGCFRLVAQSAATSSRWFLARGFLYPEDGGGTFLQNVGSHKIYKAPHPRRWHSSYLLCYNNIKYQYTLFKYTIKHHDSAHKCILQWLTTQISIPSKSASIITKDNLQLTTALVRSNLQFTVNKTSNEKKNYTQKICTYLSYFSM
jgi:hypothetical protein